MQCHFPECNIWIEITELSVCTVCDNAGYFPKQDLPILFLQHKHNYHESVIHDVHYFTKRLERIRTWLKVSFYQYKYKGSYHHASSYKLTNNCSESCCRKKPHQNVTIASFSIPNVIIWCREVHLVWYNMQYYKSKIKPFPLGSYCTVPSVYYGTISVIE